MNKILDTRIKKYNTFCKNCRYTDCYVYKSYNNIFCYKCLTTTILYKPKNNNYEYGFDDNYCGY
jgi:hypothetical protein